MNGGQFFKRSQGCGHLIDKYFWFKIRISMLECHFIGYELTVVSVVFLEFLLLLMVVYWLVPYKVLEECPILQNNVVH